MTAEKYVKSIVRLITCGRDKKKEIAKQLLSEMDERMASGEELETIISQMGSIKEIAAGFNESVTEQDKKKYKYEKTLKTAAIVVLVVFVLFSLIALCLPKTNDLADSKIFHKEEVESALVRVIDYLDAGEYDQLQQMSVDSMKEVFTAEKMDEIKAQMSDKDFGNRTSLGNIYSAEIVQYGNHFATCQVQATYENISIVYTISFDEEMKLSGLYMK